MDGGGLVGMTVLASGAVVLIYNPVALSNVYGEQARQLSLARQQQADDAATDVAGIDGVGAALAVAPAVAQVPLVLVVDDSITVRRVTQRLLQREAVILRRQFGKEVDMREAFIDLVVLNAYSGEGNTVHIHP